ncbi:MAG: M12 family metallo-peptidase, partial [Rudanella sp.]|nr:M12 family metallo-peptidase [Rudanella sp.]
MRLSFYLRCGVVLLGMILATTITYAQSGFFEPLSSTQARVATTNDRPQPERSALYRLKTGELRTYLAKAPLEFRSSAAPLRLAIPLPNGTVETFGILESPILAPAIALAHRDIKTYTGKGLANPTYMIRLTLTSSGFDAIILGVENDAVYHTKTSDNPTSEVYMTYFARDAKRASAEAQPFGARAKCGLELTPIDLKKTPTGQGRLANNTGTMLRTFRLAVAATGEFTQRKGGGNVNTAYNALVAYVNRMNAVYRVELSVAFQLVSGTNIVYPNPNTDPYDNSKQKQMLTENQTNLDAVIKPENYDIGHVFGAARGSGGGIAAKGSVCDATQKGKGVSGVGDGSFAAVFDDQLITHEVGHQFGMDHTFNSSIPVCTTREVTTSVEPGAGATIMSYGFTCGADDYESPAYQPFLNFHTVSYQQAVEFLANVSCGLSTATNNAVPAIAQFPANTTIPRSTPFELRATATDANANDVLSYSWEGTNIGNSDDTTASTFTNTAKPPFFRSYPPVSTGARLFPRLEAILNGSNNAPGDKLPSVGIATSHRLTVRDNTGGLTYQTVTVTVDGNSGPFLETTNLAGTYQGSTTQTITWSVNNTNQAPVNAANVNILLSTDGGLTFPTTLLANTPNDGTEAVTFPNITANKCRIKVIASNNVFFDISNSNFAVIDPNNQPPVAVAIPNQAGTLDVAFNYTVPA